jgi:hypothetical protein
LGTVVWLQEDRWTTLSLSHSLIKYWCAEAIAQEQHLLIPTEKDDVTDWQSSWETTDQKQDDSGLRTTRAVADELLDSLPRNLHHDQQVKKAAASSSETSPIPTATAPLGIVEETEEDDDDDAQTEAGLTIAWQYRKSVQEERSGLSTGSAKVSSSSNSKDSVFCHSFDLNGRMKDQIDLRAFVHTEVVSCRMDGVRYYRHLRSRVDELLTQPWRKVVRILLYHPKMQILNSALPLLLNYIREKQLPVVLLVAVQPWTIRSQDIPAARRLQRLSDVVLEVEGFASRQTYPPPAEFRTLHGLLHVTKVSTVTAAASSGHFADATVSKRPAAFLYGIKRDRRKLHIQLLHIPPEEYAEGGSSVGGTGVRSGGGRMSAETKKATGGCGSVGGSTHLEF